MKTKYCTKCNKEKSVDEFYNDSSKSDGLRTDCKECRKKYVKENLENINKYNKYYKLKYPWKRVIYDIRKRCKDKNNKDYGGRGIKCLITEEQIKHLWFRDKAYSMNIPSINRKNNDGNYELSNCEFIEKGMNTTERNIRISSKPIIQFDLNNNFIKEFKSGIQACKELGINTNSLSRTCIGKYKTAGGYKWRYKNEN